MTTYRVFSATADEPTHVAAGYDYVSTGNYLYDPVHPPLSRLVCALTVRLGGVSSPPPEQYKTIQSVWRADLRGRDLLWQRGAYQHNLAYARLGNLFFFLGALIAIWLWSLRWFGSGVALIAVALFGSLPPILAHAGLATTDFSIVATLTLALFVLELWLERPDFARTLLLGLAIGAGLISKGSFIPFAGVAGVVIILLSPRRSPLRTRIMPVLLAAVVAAIVVWSAYRFEVGTMADTSPDVPTAMRTIAGEAGVRFAAMRIPAPTFFTGFALVSLHARHGHPAFLLGRYSDHGFWSYFPVAVSVKTPLPFLILVAAGMTLLVRRALRRRSLADLKLAVIPLAFLVSVLPATLNIGIRHVLVIYPFMAIVAALGTVDLWQTSKRAARIAVVLLGAWYAINTSLAHPDYLAWFNELAGRHPERVLVDSNLDWGQDYLRLANAVREERIDRMSTLLFADGDYARLGLPPRTPLQPNVRTPGWIAVSETALQMAGAENFAWLERERLVRRVGKTIRLYQVR